MGANFAMDELVALLKQQRGAETPGYSAKELAEMLGRSASWVQYHLRRLYKQGIIGCGFRQARRIDGQPYQMPVYYLKSPENRQNFEE